MTVQRSPVVSESRVALPRRANTENADAFEISSDALLAMADYDLRTLLGKLGITISTDGYGVPSWSRDKMLDTIMRIALSARDS